jgi:DNA-binding transcriptional regulator LsrR (DeoR family)
MATTKHALNKARQKQMVLDLMFNRGKRRFCTPHSIARRTGISRTTVNNYLQEFSNEGICRSVRVLSSDGTCAWGLCEDKTRE